jgi:hypothetical protein
MTSDLDTLYISPVVVVNFSQMEFIRSSSFVTMKLPIRGKFERMFDQIVFHLINEEHKFILILTIQFQNSMPSVKVMSMDPWIPIFFIEYGQHALILQARELQNFIFRSRIPNYVKIAQLTVNI